MFATIFQANKIARTQNKFKYNSLHNVELSFCCRNEKISNLSQKDDKGFCSVTFLKYAQKEEKKHYHFCNQIDENHTFNLKRKIN